MKAAMLALAFLIVATGAASADTGGIECQSKAGGSGWSWRQIDGKRCWYRGRRKVDKKLLHWPTASKPVAKKKRERRVIEPLTFPEAPMPPMPKPITFEERWCAQCIKGQ